MVEGLDSLRYPDQQKVLSLISDKYKQSKPEGIEDDSKKKDAEEKGSKRSRKKMEGGIRISSAL